MRWTSTGSRGTEFSAGVFTNLSQDHLDYHRTMEAYFASKAQLFRAGQVGVAVINREGPVGSTLGRTSIRERHTGGDFRA